MRLGVDVPGLLGRLGIDGRRRGRAWWARCPSPDHKERTPSWSIVDDPEGERHGFHHCFACGEGGGPAHLAALALDLRRDDGELDLRAARAWLLEEGVAREAELPVEVDVEVAGTAALARVVLPRGVVVAELAAWATPARRYAERRGLTPEQVARWGVGYAVDGRLAGRLVFPVRDRRGRLLSYTARDFAGAGRRKYLEPDRAERADKAAVFGEQHWPDARARVVVVEGALDALAVERVFGGAIGAVFGSELLPATVARLSTFAEVVIASDPDKAGTKLAAQIAGALGRSSRVRRALLPDGHDAASLARDEPEELARVLAGAA